ncbi:MAG: sulfite exporter TauE/SafE family protein, partial [Chloroflexi bacterium]|nr:sulfite exporter TauE/SafE family protein [Chloroflexota bacterium]
MGVGGAFVVTPALNILGFPMPYAIGTDLTHVMGKSIVATLRHNLLGNIDFRMGLLMVLGTLPGVEVGKRLILYLEGTGNVENVVRLVYIPFLVILASAVIWDERRHIRQERSAGHNSPRPARPGWLQFLKLPPLVSFPRSHIPRLSLWGIVGVGFLAGMLSAFLGVGAGFFRMAAMIYLLGMPTLVAVGTDLFEIIISAGFGGFTYAMAGRVDPVAALIMLVGASAGAEIGALAAVSAGSHRIRLYLALLHLGAAASVALKQASVAWDIAGLEDLAFYLLIGVATAMCAIILAPFLARRWRWGWKKEPEHPLELPQRGFDGVVGSERREK